jgi:GR25 family glycosyltransferase involved in LPS biosynthesis
MEGYIIYLPGYANSVDWASFALESAIKNNWSVSLYAGVDGKKEKIQNYNLFYNESKKVKRLFENPGVHGCFLSHYNLWKKAAIENRTISIFEHDVEFLKSFQNKKFEDVIKYEGFKQAKPIKAGNWWEGARAYSITPIAATKIINWVHQNGVMPADWCLCDGIVNIVFDQNNLVGVKQREFSFTKDL